jgi:hypothetical protein
MHLLVYQDRCVHVVLHRAASPAHVLRSYIHALRLLEALSGGLRGFILQKDGSGIDAAELEAAVWMTEYYDRFLEKVRVALSFEQHAQCRSLFFASLCVSNDQVLVRCLGFHSDGQYF